MLIPVCLFSIFWPFGTCLDSCLLHFVLGSRLSVLGPTSAPSQCTPSTSIFSPGACLFSPPQCRCRTGCYSSYISILSSVSSLDGYAWPLLSVCRFRSCNMSPASSSSGSDARIFSIAGGASPLWFLSSIAGASRLSVACCFCLFSSTAIPVSSTAVVGGLSRPLCRHFPP